MGCIEFVNNNNDIKYSFHYYHLPQITSQKQVLIFKTLDLFHHISRVTWGSHPSLEVRIEAKKSRMSLLACSLRNTVREVFLRTGRWGLIWLVSQSHQLSDYFKEEAME
jgi:hypothetical protein